MRRRQRLGGRRGGGSGPTDREVAVIEDEQNEWEKNTHEEWKKYIGLQIFESLESSPRLQDCNSWSKTEENHPYGEKPVAHMPYCHSMPPPLCFLPMPTIASAGQSDIHLLRWSYFARQLLWQNLKMNRMQKLKRKRSHCHVPSVPSSCCRGFEQSTCVSALDVEHMRMRGGGEAFHHRMRMGREEALVISADQGAPLFLGVLTRTGKALLRLISEGP
uniref:Uncharacterized protein n=1 Tax=Oryza rufipogon TaxID=4529 RepID=A0A0E0PYL9_ORYRU